MGTHIQGREQVLNILPPDTKTTQHLTKTYIPGWTRDVPYTSLLSKYIGDRVLKLEPFEEAIQNTSCMSVFRE